MSSVNVIDASAMLAFLLKEKGHEALGDALDAGPSWATTVNTCEVLSKLCEKGMPAMEARGALDELGLIEINFDVDLSNRAAVLRTRTKSIGASLGDRACLALAERAHAQNGSVVYTTDASWTKIRWPFKVHLIRA